MTKSRFTAKEVSVSPRQSPICLSLWPDAELRYCRSGVIPRRILPVFCVRTSLYQATALWKSGKRIKKMNCLGICLQRAPIFRILRKRYLR